MDIISNGTGPVKRAVLVIRRPIRYNFHRKKGGDAVKRNVIGILAHVDAGKTTLSEALLYTAGSIRKAGRVDHGDAFLDTFEMERKRGITIFSKQAVLTLPDVQFTLLDTPGHVDFAPEMERTLSVLDGAVLVISGTDGVQSHTVTVWRLLRKWRIPTFLFVNKMDLAGADREKTARSLQKQLSTRCYDAGGDPEAPAECDEELMEEFLAAGTVGPDSLRKAVAECRIFPCWYGSALKLQGVEPLLDGMRELMPSVRPETERFGARVFKIARDEQGARLTYIKITSGCLQVRDGVTIGEKEEKITRLRVYSGKKYTQTDRALPGDVVAAEGLTATRPGQGLGECPSAADVQMEPVLNYSVILPEGTDPVSVLPFFRQMEEEEPQLHVDWSEQLREIRVRLMGPVQLDILREQMAERFGLAVDFGAGRIQYRETIADTVEGVGHYEPLRHYAEVHLILEPGEEGSGIVLASSCPEDDLDRNWQRLILTHLAEKKHAGVLTGSPLTDIRITLAAGKAHEKHTEGGDFRQATYRAVRQGLMQAQSVLLEPWYDFVLTVPGANLGRAMTDLNAMNAVFTIEQSGEPSVLTGSVAVSESREYPSEVASYTHGLGRAVFSFGGYRPCRDAEAVIGEIGYRPEADTENPADSVFCSHGAGVVVNWKDVPSRMHLPGVLAPIREREQREMARRYAAMAADDEELRRIFERTYGPVRDRRFGRTAPERSGRETEKPYRAAPVRTGPEYVLVDGYNIIFAWEELRKLAEKSLDSARARLLEILRNYQGFRQNRVILVFDAYKVKGNPGTVERFGGVDVVYTKEAETADMYIEKVSSRLARDCRVRVATSDGLEQIIVLSHGCLRVPASQFEAEIRETDRAIRAFLSEESRN